MKGFRRIGPYLKLKHGSTLWIQTAIECDLECGSRWLAEVKAMRMNKEFPTIIAMAGLIEKERDSLRRRLRRLQRRQHKT